MISEEIRQAISAMHGKGMKIRAISRNLGIARNTVRLVLQGNKRAQSEETSSFEDKLPHIAEMYHKCGGNVVRVQEMLMDQGLDIRYSTLTRLVQDMGLRQPQKVKAGSYSFAPGEEMQHDTSPHKVSLNGKTVTAQCAGLVLAYQENSSSGITPVSLVSRPGSFFRRRFSLWTGAVGGW